jgi:hypothetical protein
MVPAITARDEMIATAPGDPTTDRHELVQTAPSAAVRGAPARGAAVKAVPAGVPRAGGSGLGGPAAPVASPTSRTGRAAAPSGLPAAPGEARAAPGEAPAGPGAGTDARTVRGMTSAAPTAPVIGVGPATRAVTGTNAGPRAPAVPAARVAVRRHGHRARAAGGPATTGARPRAGTWHPGATGTAAAGTSGLALTGPVVRSVAGGPDVHLRAMRVVAGRSADLRSVGRPVRPVGTARHAAREARRAVGIATTVAPAPAPAVVTGAETGGTSAPRARIAAGIERRTGATGVAIAATPALTGAAAMTGAATAPVVGGVTGRTPGEPTANPAGLRTVSPVGRAIGRPAGQVTAHTTGQMTVRGAGEATGRKAKEGTAAPAVLTSARTARGLTGTTGRTAGEMIVRLVAVGRGTAARSALPVAMTSAPGAPAIRGAARSRSGAARSDTGRHLLVPILAASSDDRAATRIGRPVRSGGAPAGRASEAHPPTAARAPTDGTSGAVVAAVMHPAAAVPRNARRVARDRGALPRACPSRAWRSRR